MKTQQLITVNEFCRLHHIEMSFINLLEEAGLVRLMERDQQQFIEHHQLRQLEIEWNKHRAS